MSRYIKMDEFSIEPLKQSSIEFDAGILYALRKLDEQPTADVVEVVRCKDCKHFHDGIYNGEYWMECDEYRIALSSDEWFCADGERGEDD